METSFSNNGSLTARQVFDPYRSALEGPLIINAVLLSLPANKTKDGREEIIYTSRRIQLHNTIPGLIIYLEEGK